VNEVLSIFMCFFPPIVKEHRVPIIRDMVILFPCFLSIDS